MWLIYTTGVIALAALCVATLLRVRRELPSKGRLETGTIVLAAGAYLLHGALTITASWNSTWPLEVSRVGCAFLGGSMAIVGALIHLAGSAEFGSFRLTAGLASDRLVTSGIYRVSRNPQNLGWGLVLAGWALMGRSALALLLAGLFWVLFLIYLPVEEWFLERRFGDEYRLFRASSPRFLGWPRRRRAYGAAGRESMAAGGGPSAPGRGAAADPPLAGSSHPPGARP